MLVINKTDLVTADQLSQLKALLSKLNPSAQVRDRTHGVGLCSIQVVCKDRKVFIASHCKLVAVGLGCFCK